MAAACGLSHTAVSLALRGSAEIAPATRQRILATAVAMQYVPDENARRLQARSSGKIAYVASRLAHGFVGQVLVGMEQRAFDTQRYFNAVTPYSTWFQTEAGDAILRQILHGGLADAVVMVSTVPPKPLLADFKRLGLPLVLVEGQHPDFHSVRVDNVLGARLATEHLLRQGCRRLALVAGIVGGKGMALNPSTVERREGFKLGLRGSGQNAAKRPVADIGYYDVPSGAKALDQLLKADPKIDGIFCAAGDRVALGILGRCRERGLRVPQDIKVVGYDDIEFAALTAPALCTVRQPVEDLGARAFDLAVQAADGKLAEPVHIVIKPELVLRQSSR